MTPRAVVFDMDGTLLHTMPDLAAAANEALCEMGFPLHSQDDMLACMGRGGRWMIEHIVPTEATSAQRNETFEIWRDRYIRSNYSLTAPFEGVPDMLGALRAQGLKLAILSNKFDAGVRMLAERHFPATFDAIRGDAPPLPRKPDPASLLQMLEELDVAPGQTAYVGDAVVDVQLARNAGTKAIGVSWGYDTAAPLPVPDLDAYARTPRDLVRLFQQ